MNVVLCDKGVEEIIAIPASWRFGLDSRLHCLLGLQSRWIKGDTDRKN